MDVSVILQFSAGTESLKSFLPRLRAVLQQLHVSFEILAVNSGLAGNLNDLVTETEVRLVEDADGYASGLLASFRQARGEYCLTLDADMSH
jgi:glycosyltransferase involved in cell wall biosynthesis